MRNTRIDDIGNDINISPREIIIRDQKPETIHDPEFNIFVNLHPTDGTHWVLVIRRVGGPIFYFDGLVLRLNQYS